VTKKINPDRIGLLSMALMVVSVFTLTCALSLDCVGVGVLCIFGGCVAIVGAYAADRYECDDWRTR